MAYQFLIYSRDKAKIWDCKNLVQEVKVTTNRTGSPGKLTFTLLKTPEIDLQEGDLVQFLVDGTKVFAGFVFTQKIDRWGVVDVTCYDQTRYLLANQSYVFTGKKAGDIIRQIAGDFGLQVGEIEDTGYTIPSLVQENKPCLDMIAYAIERTTSNTGDIFVFYDDFGKLCLKKASHLMRNQVLGKGSLVGEYTYTSDIDSETYNQIKLVRPNKETGRADTVIFKDTGSIQKWGLLQYYNSVDENLNDAQMQEQAKTMLAYYNRTLQKLSIESLGVVGLRAGAMVYLNLPDIGGKKISRFLLLDKVDHTFQPSFHTMSAEMRVVEG